MLRGQIDIEVQIFDRTQNFDRENLKGLSPSTTPFGKRNFIRTVKKRIPKPTILSIPKMGL